MKKINDGGQAYPCYVHDIGWCYGMSLRDYFAGQALTKTMVFVGHPAGMDAEDAAAKLAYQYADAMLQAREAKP